MSLIKRLWNAWDPYPTWKGALWLIAIEFVAALVLVEVINFIFGA